jgi:hypothetical protein
MRRRSHREAASHRVCSVEDLQDFLRAVMYSRTLAAGSGAVSRSWCLQRRVDLDHRWLGRCGIENVSAAGRCLISLRANGIRPLVAAGSGWSAAVMKVPHGPTFTGLQFHPQSVLTLDGLGILRRAMKRLLAEF